VEDAVRFTPENVAVTVTLVGTPTAFVAAEKVALADPASIVTLAGTDTTAGLELLSSTRTPPCGAMPVSATDALTVFPP
jgi:hypothetical protein